MKWLYLHGADYEQYLNFAYIKDIAAVADQGVCILTNTDHHVVFPCDYATAKLVQQDIIDWAEKDGLHIYDISDKLPHCKSDA